MNDQIIYSGKDLEAMDFAVNYHKWILDEFRPYLGRRIVEVGAGTGSFSCLLLETEPESLDLVEPSQMFAALKENVSRIKTTTSLLLHNSLFANLSPTMPTARKPDSILYINVLEHIEDDRKELDLIYQALSSGGRCLVFVPALRWLYSKQDREIGHIRRYSKKEIEEKFRLAGFKILKSRYFDLAGVIPWFLKYTLLGSTSLGSGTVAIYDKIVVPFMRIAEKFPFVPVGKNILIVGERPEVDEPDHPENTADDRT